MIQVIRPAEELFVGCPEFKLLADAMPQIVWLADSEGVTYYYNAKWYEYIGNEEGHDKEPYFYSVVLHPEDSEHAKITWKECVREKKEFKLEYRFTDKKNGGYRWFLARALPVTDPRGNLTWYGTYTDINDQKEAVQFRDDFLSIAGHELKTPMTTLRMQIQMALRNLKSGKIFSSELHEKMLNNCLKQSNRLTSLVNGLLDITHIKQGKFKFQFNDADVSEIIRSVSSEMSQHVGPSGTKIDLELPPGLMAKVDTRRIEQVFLNLYINSSKYAPGSDIKIKASEENQSLKITYQDFGPGIDPSMQSRVFQRFERSSYNDHISGLGLGLYIVKKIVEGHNGNIKLTSRTGEGVMFEIIIPRAEAPAIMLKEI